MTALGSSIRPVSSYPGVRIIVSDDEYVGVAREEWRRLTDLMNDYNVTYVQVSLSPILATSSPPLSNLKLRRVLTWRGVQLVPRVGLSAGRNALVEACTTK